ncbi:DUF805 domain-containing protein [Collimonas sp.]|jgi:uncharacterized membrane protein YhaH (DUF805 family)|uniref:DUF805 domain-containing protein n=1 Tax=Collimonas sp. TaxID=1963772 RepID=UPI002C577A9A|nr:DUF805 domain-containing protein [Collimonas sp.]HWX03912.1 DUF805 domain-containing protein [Collimonas sp.]
MTFTESIKVCFSKYVDFNGRASRSEYWWFILFIVVATVIADTIHHKLGLLISLATLLPSIAAAARRLHDTDRSGWWLLLSLIPIIGGLVVLYFLILEGKEPNRFGSAPVSEALPET